MRTAIMTVTAVLVVYWGVHSPLNSSTMAIGPSLREAPAGLFLDILVDQDGTLTIDEAAGPAYTDKWVPSKRPSPGFGFTDKVYWARLSVKNSSERKIEFLIEQGYPLIDRLTLFQRDRSGQFQSVLTGDRIPYYDRPFRYRTFVFPCSLEGGVEKTYYLRHETTSSMNLTVNLWGAEAFRDAAAGEDRILMLYYGVIIIMIINYLLVFIFIRHVSFVYYVFFMAFFLIFIMTQNGTAFQFLWPESPLWANYCIPLFLCLLNIFGYLFTISFLQVKVNAPKLYRVSMLLCGIIALWLIFSSAAPLTGLYSLTMAGSAYLTIFSVFFALAAGVLLSLKRLRTAYFLTGAWIAFLAGSILYLGKSFGILPSNLITTWSIQMGSITTLLLLSIALVDRINIMRKELQVLSDGLKIKVQERSIELLFSEISAKLYNDLQGARPDEANGVLNTAPLHSLLDSNRIQTIEELSRDISIIYNLDELLQSVALKAAEIVGADRAFLFLRDKKERPSLMASIEMQSPLPGEISESILDEVMNEGIYRLGETDLDATPGIYVPIVTDGAVIGACYLGNTHGKDFNDHDARLLFSFLSGISPAIENSQRLHVLADESLSEPTITSDTEDKVLKAIAYIEENYTFDISREGLAHSLGTSPNHLGKFFLIYTGEKIGDYINKLRIRDAAVQLTESDKTIINIAFSVGFDSLRTFNRAFKKIMGIAPSEYRKLNQHTGCHPS